MKPVLSPHIIEALASVDGPTLANAIERFKVRDDSVGYASLELRCQYPALPPMVGYAVTCLVNSTSPAASQPRRNQLFELFDAVAAVPQPCVVVMQSIGPDRLRTCVAGDILSAIFHRLGAAGLVTDGAVRDLRTIPERAPGFQVFSAGAVVSHGTGVYFDIGATVSVCGMIIQPGDLLHGDENGLLSVPLDVAEQVIESVRQIQDQERALAEFIQSVGFSLPSLKKLMTH